MVKYRNNSIYKYKNIEPEKTCLFCVYLEDFTCGYTADVQVTGKCGNKHSFRYNEKIYCHKDVCSLFDEVG
jgi:hypothetical protein